MVEGYDLNEVLKHLDPADLSYQEWLSVGMALHDEGFSVSTWEAWSSRDAARYHAGECGRKWSGFRGVSNPITAGTVVQLAKDHGWRPEPGPGMELEWDSVIGGKDDLVIINKEWVEGKEISEPQNWQPEKQLIKYLETLFDSAENVGYVTRSYEKDGRYLPDRGCYDRTAGLLIQQLNNCNGDIGGVLGDYNPDVGAWIRFNPLDGKGVKNENVTDFRFALVESDSMDLEKQYAIIHDLELPVACLVHSGSKSLHAIVRIDAKSYEEYRTRVDYLYSVCRKNGMDIDTQNRNPSRLSRMPGVMRSGRKQFLVDTNIGRTSWDEWREWIESVNDDLPDPESIADVWDHLPELSPPLISGILRQGHKMLLAGPSKAGKSFALIELCCSIAEGRPWLGFTCAQGKVLYVNLELDRASCLHRFKDVYDALHWQPRGLGNIDVWNLRGKSIPMDKLAPKLIRRAAKKQYIAIVIDPIYKVITGDENSADQMAQFCNQFDKVCTELGCAVVYCHHHSKGMQGQKKSMDRASGSGVFARDPDALLDLIELETTDAQIAQETNKAVAAVCCEWLNRCVDDWEDHISQDDMCSQSAMLKACERLLSPYTFKAMQASIETAKHVCRQLTAWRIDGTLREFEKFPPINFWFRYPIHQLDGSGALKDAKTDGSSSWQTAMGRRKPKETKQKDRKESVETAFEACNIDVGVTVQSLSEYMSVSEKTVRNRLKEHGGFWIDEGNVGKKT
ncbi:MAG: AAA family ATPase [Clostridia bacterium]